MFSVFKQKTDKRGRPFFKNRPLAIDDYFSRIAGFVRRGGFHKPPYFLGVSAKVATR